MSGVRPLEFHPVLPPEEVARANFYGLLARLFYAPPDQALLDALAGAQAVEAEDGGIGPAWRALAEAAAAADAEAVREEHETAFIGTGKAPVTLYTCAYTLKYSNETPLATLRGELAELGLARREDAAEPEDHIAALCDTMRHLIVQKRDLDDQHRFFQRWIAPAYGPLCDAIAACSHTRFYKDVAGFARAFLELEQNAFELH